MEFCCTPTFQGVSLSSSFVGRSDGASGTPSSLPSVTMLRSSAEICVTTSVISPATTATRSAGKVLTAYRNAMTDRTPLTHRERLLTILDGGLADRIPWIPRIQLWYQARKLTGTMPEKWKDLSLREVEKELRIGTPARDGRIFRLVFEGVEIRESFEDGKQLTTYQTPRGSLRSVYPRPSR